MHRTLYSDYIYKYDATFAAISCGLCFFCGLLFTTGAGEYWLSLFDRYAAMGLTLIAFIEIVSVMYVYGHRRFTDDIQEMTGYRYDE